VSGERKIESYEWMNYHHRYPTSSWKTTNRDTRNYTITAPNTTKIRCLSVLNEWHPEAKTNLCRIVNRENNTVF